MTVNNTADQNNDNQPSVSREQALAGWGEPQVMEERAPIEEGKRPSAEEEGRLPTRAELEAVNEEDTDGGKSKTKDDEDLEVDDPEEETPEEPVVTVPDPGEFTPQDYSFSVTYYQDEEGKKPKTVKITSVEQAEELLEKDPNFGSAKDLLDFNRRVTKMETNIDRDKDKWQQAKDAYNQAKEEAEARSGYTEKLFNEINYLVGKGKLPAVDKKLQSANWRDPEVAKQPGVKEQVALLKYMDKESRVRMRAGLPPFTSAVDAYNAMQLDGVETKRKEANKETGEARKAAGARVAGASPAPMAAAKSGISVGRVQPGGLQNLGNDWS